jgi:polyisoprenoid-binding protein YceI
MATPMRPPVTLLAGLLVLVAGLGGIAGLAGGPAALAKPGHEAPAPAGRFVVRAADSYVGYRIQKFGVVPVRGRFAQVTGEIVIDPARPERSRAAIRVPLRSLESGDPARTDTLLSEDFFDAREHPDMLFVSERVARGREGEWLVSGGLTIRGVTRTVTVPVELHGGEAGEANFAVFSTRFTLDRRDFGVLGTRWSAGRSILAHEVEIELALTARAEG